MGNLAKADTRAAALAERRNQALELRKRGCTYRQIATALKTTVSAVHKYVHDEIARIPRDNAEDVLVLELERLDRMIKGLDVRASQGDPKAVLATVKLMERRAKYLGLDAPTKLEHSGSIDVTQMTDEELRRVAAGSGKS